MHICLLLLTVSCFLLSVSFQFHSYYFIPFPLSPFNKAVHFHMCYWDHILVQMMLVALNPKRSG